MTPHEMYEWTIAHWKSLTKEKKIEAMSKYASAGGYSMLTGEDIVWILENQYD